LRRIWQGLHKGVFLAVWNQVADFIVRLVLFNLILLLLNLPEIFLVFIVLVILGVTTASVDVHSCGDWLSFIELGKAILTAAAVTIAVMLELNFSLVKKLRKLILDRGSWV
jgi:hypothetical protein